MLLPPELTRIINGAVEVHAMDTGDEVLLNDITQDAPGVVICAAPSQVPNSIEMDRMVISEDTRIWSPPKVDAGAAYLPQLIERARSAFGNLHPATPGIGVLVKVFVWPADGLGYIPCSIIAMAQPDWSVTYRPMSLISDRSLMVRESTSYSLPGLLAMWWRERKGRPHVDAEPVSPAELRSALQECLAREWGQFGDAVRHAARRPAPSDPDRWSIDMFDRADQIRELTNLVGLASQGDVPLDVLSDGWWEAVHQYIGHPAAPIEPRIQKLIEDRRRQHG